MHREEGWWSVCAWQERGGTEEQQTLPWTGLLRKRRKMSTVNVMLAKKEKLEEDLKGLEKQLYDLETSYFYDAGQGNVLKGYEGYLALNKHARYDIHLYILFTRLE